MKPYYTDDCVTIYHGDCREILPSLSADLLVTDPPYGINYRTPPGRVRFPKSGWTLEGDAEPFNPAHLLRFDRAVIFGANHFADKLPPSAGWIVWDKRDGMPSNHQSDCELAWTNTLGSVRLIPARWNGGGSLLAENGPARAIHPTQKPLRLMRGVLALVAAPGVTVVDPYAGTGTTLVAAKGRGLRAIGIEIEERYCAIAAERCAQDVLFPEAA